MSNLGAYQQITCISKKLGGPINLLLITGLAGAIIYKGGELFVKHSAKAIKSSFKVKGTAKRRICSAHVSCESDDGLLFGKGDQFRILEIDGDSVLIEKIGDKNNPYFVSGKLLHNISDYKR